jgi:hypothetical protein
MRDAPPQHQRTDGVGIAEAEHAVADDHRDDGVTAADAPVHAAHGVEDVARARRGLPELLQLVREDVEQHLRIRAGMQVTLVSAREHLGERGRVGQVAVVCQADPVRRVDVERLRFARSRAARRRVAHVSQSEIPAQRQHVALFEDIAHEPVRLARVQRAAFESHDAGRVLAAMLEYREGVIQRLVDRAVTRDADEAAHQVGCSLGTLGN